MKPGRDLSLTAWTRPALADAQPWDVGAPSLMLDFARELYLRGAGFAPLEQALSFARASTALYRDATGVLRTASADVPRFDHDPMTGAALGLLVEGAATNTMLHSTALQSAGLSESVTTAPGPQVRYVQANAGLAPDGTMTAAKVIESTDTDMQRISKVSLGLTIGETYTFSVFAKAAERSRIEVRAQTSGGATFDLVDGTWTPVGSGIVAGMTPVRNGWFRCWVTTVVNNTAESSWVVLNNGTGTTYAGDGVSGVYLWGAQFEAGGLSSLIVTGASPVTRAGDIVRVAPGVTVDHPEGTVCIEAVAGIVKADGTQALLELNDGTVNNRVIMRTAQLEADVVSGGVTTATLGIPAMVDGVASRRAIAWAENDFAAVADGGAVVTDLAGAVPSGMNEFWLGVRDGAGQYGLDGHIRRVLYYPRRLTDAQLQEITA